MANENGEKRIDEDLLGACEAKRQRLQSKLDTWTIAGGIGAAVLAVATGAIGFALGRRRKET